MKIYDLIGIGIGPSNLSTAALLQPHQGKIKSIFFDEKEEFAWHPGMLFPDATIQVSILKDLVTMVDPTSKFSFLSFLKEVGRLYLFASKGKFDDLKRREFVQYFKWVATSLPNLHFSSPVEYVDYSKGSFEIKTGKQMHKSKNIVIGAGLTAHVPEFCLPYLGTKVVHASQFLSSGVNFKDKRVIVVGGGQSGAEVVLHLLKDPQKDPESIHWVCSTYNFFPMENTPFSNELYTPNYSDYFYQLHKDDKEKLLEKQKFTSDGVSEKTLNEVYELVYNYKFLHHKDILDFYLDTYLTKLEPKGDSFLAGITLKGTKKVHQDLQADVIVLATGFKYQIPKCLESMAPYFVITDGKFEVAEDYSILPQNKMEGKIYLHNGARHVRGVADPNLSLVAWRSAKIINSVANKSIYNTEIDQSLFNWNKMANIKNKVTI